MSALIAEILGYFWSFVPRLDTLSPWEAGMRVTLGKKVKPIGAGWYIVWPLFQEINYMEVQPQTVDLRVQSVWTQDGVDLAISGGIKYRITDAVKAQTDIQDLDEDIQLVAMGVIADYVTARNVDECRKIGDLKSELLKGVRVEAAGWGVKIERIYITDIGRARNIRLLHHNE